MADISAPNAAAYGIWGPAYAQLLASQQDAIRGPLNALALQSFMQREQGGYGEALARTQQAQLANARLEADAKTAQQFISSLPALAQYGHAGILPSDQFGIETNAPAIAAGDANVAADLAAGVFKDRTTGVGTLAELGLLPTPADTSNVIFDPEAVTSPPQLLPYQTPDAVTDARVADARMISANADATSAAASAYRAHNPRASSAGATTYTIVPPLFEGMPPSISIRTRDPNVVDEYRGSGQARENRGNSVERSGGARSARDRLEDLRRGR